VSLQYRSESAHESVVILQSSEADRGSVWDELTGSGHWDEVLRDGVAIHVTKGGHQAQAYLERAGTFVFLMSETLSTEQLATIAAELTAAPTTSSI
jgi:hypothetical protein